jgi:hypothetical protein
MAALVRIGESDEVVPMIASLLSDGSHRFNGHCIEVFGGIGPRVETASGPKASTFVTVIACSSRASIVES